MGHVESGRHTGLSVAMLSKVERGKLFPTLSTLYRIAVPYMREEASGDRLGQIVKDISFPGPYSPNLKILL